MPLQKVRNLQSKRHLRIPLPQVKRLLQKLKYKRPRMKTSPMTARNNLPRKKIAAPVLPVIRKRSTRNHNNHNEKVSTAKDLIDMLKNGDDKMTDSAVMEMVANLKKLNKTLNDNAGGSITNIATFANDLQSFVKTVHDKVGRANFIKHVKRSLFP